jgi:hypothetical protein
MTEALDTVSRDDGHFTRLERLAEHAEPRHDGEVLDSETAEFSPEMIAKGQQVYEYYQHLDPDGPVPPDETKTHFFSRIIDEAQADKVE